MLGNNMFAYCLNNPINRIDETGTTSLWYYLVVDSDFGFVHRMVQLHIISVYGGIFRKELTIEGLKRADIVDTSTGAVWEVKHASTTPEKRITEAQRQAQTYVGGTSKTGTKITHLGEAGAFSGFFYILCQGSYYRVDYWTPQDGAILYSVKEDSNYSGEAYIAYIPVTERKTSDLAALSGLAMLGFSFSSSSGGSSRIRSTQVQVIPIR